MLDLKFVRENIDLVKKKMNERGLEIDFNDFMRVDNEWRAILREVENLRCERNSVSEQIAQLKREKKDATEKIKAMREVSQRIKDLEVKLEEKENVLRSLLLVMPNIPHDTVVPGRCSDDNPEIRKWGGRPNFSFAPKPHWELGESLGILDFERGAKITGARFTLYWALGALLERALINFMLDLHTKKHGYVEVLPPFLVNRKSMTGTGQLPKFEEDLFKTSLDFFLVPTAEVPVTNIHANEVLSEKDLPLYYTAYTPCFRKEAGSAGKDTRGLIRQHQFNKVELVKFTTPETSYDELEKLLINAEEVLKRLEIHYRVVSLCSADLGFSASKTYDIEVWLPGQDVYREISSCSNFEDFQARRANIRYRTENGKMRYVHTLNGSGLAVGRTLVAVLENYQQEDGTVIVPKALRPFMDGIEVIKPRG
jgi:seryl-tRNA synthetase